MAAASRAAFQPTLPAPQHHHTRWPHAGAAADQDATAALGFLQQPGAHLRREAASDFAHRCQQRQAAVIELHGFIGDGRGAGIEQGTAYGGIGGKVQIGEQHQITPQKAEFFWLWLLHLHHQVRTPGFRLIHHGRPGGFKRRIADASAFAGSLLDAHLQAMAHQLPHRIGCERHPPFIGLDLPRHADAGDRGDGAGHVAGAGAGQPSAWRCWQGLATSPTTMRRGQRSHCPKAPLGLFAGLLVVMEAVRLASFGFLLVSHLGAWHVN